jgi:hypothetical protein
MLDEALTSSSWREDARSAAKKPVEGGAQPVLRTPDQWLGVLDPAELHTLILALFDRERQGRQTIGISTIAATILEQHGYVPGPERGQTYPALTEALAALIPQIKGLRYVAGMA